MQRRSKARSLSLARKVRQDSPRNKMMRRWLLLLLLPAMDTGVLPLCAAGQGSQVVVVYNTRVAESKSVAEHYAEVRQVPDGQVLGLDLPDNETISRADFHDRLQ